MLVYMYMCTATMYSIVQNVAGVIHSVLVGLQVAARVRTEDGEEQWILAEVVSYNSHNHRYVVDDIDEEGHNEKRFVYACLVPYTCSNNTYMYIL